MTCKQPLHSLLDPPGAATARCRGSPNSKPLLVAVTALNGFNSEWEGPLTQHVVAPAVLTALLPPRLLLVTFKSEKVPGK